ncbi:MAG TPA: CAP domain-containing protein [Spirochaetota bacterium]|nr:CAP domain-containing protein [Spirochaetota bacterium]HPH03379.1 CAP domain-containing protein [Spirochaetota bacterium]HPN82590.1 CAP domain-containing protein [Spirochaetota bacterium]
MIRFLVMTLLVIALLPGCFVTVSERSQNDRGTSGANTVTDEPSSTGGVSDSVRTVERRAFDLINQYRRSIGLPSLIWNEAIARQCRNHSQYMANRGSLSHDNFSQRLNNLRSSMQVMAGAENVAMNYNMPDPALVAKNGWIRSPGHHKNIKGNYTHSGMGVVRTSDGKYYLTQVFVRQ